MLIAYSYGGPGYGPPLEPGPGHPLKLELVSPGGTRYLIASWPDNATAPWVMYWAPGGARAMLGTSNSSGVESWQQLTLAGTYAGHPECEMADLVQGIELRDLEPVSPEHFVQDRVHGDSVSNFLEHYSGCPALLVDQQVTKYVQSFRPGEMAQACGIEYQD